MSSLAGPSAAAEPDAVDSPAETVSNYEAPETYVEPFASRQPTVETVENKIRSHVLVYRIRLTDLFADFDRLRTGYVSENQFRRSLGQAMAKGMVTPLTEQEVGLLIREYEGMGDRSGRIKWTSFVDSIDKVFGAKKLESSPTRYIPAPHEVVHPIRPLSPASQQMLNEVMERLRQYVKHHGSDVKSWFKDFDKHNNGLITYNQFRRGLPQNVLSQEEEELLLSQYKEELTSTVNYFKMNTDVNRKVRKGRPAPSQLVEKPHAENQENEHVPIGTEELLHAVGTYSNANSSLNDVEDSIKKQVYKERIRLIEFFKDYDRHNVGYVTLNQFLAGMRLASVMLDKSQLEILIQGYKDPKTNSVAYRRLCNNIDTVFTISHLEKQPTVEVQPPAREYLIQGCNELSPVEEARCREIIAYMRQKLRERRLLLVPYFKDFEKHTGNTGRVSRSHFSRLLSTMNLDVSDNDLHILFKKFEDRRTAKVVYMEFIRTIDPETYGGNPTPPRQVQSKPTHGQSEDEDATAVRTATAPEIMDRLRVHVATQRIRVSEFFRDFDKLRCYSIPKQEFIRAVNMIGVNLTEEEYEVLAEVYRDERRAGCCLWKEFEQSIERVFNDTGLERHPTKVPETAPIPKSPFGTVGALSPAEEKILQNTLKSIAEHMKVRQTSIKPFFKDFDKLYTGHVTKIQFRQCLTYLKVNVTDEEFEILCKRWSKSSQEAAQSLPHATQRQQLSSRPPTRDPIKDGAEPICYLTFLEEVEQVMTGGGTPGGGGRRPGPTFGSSAATVPATATTAPLLDAALKRPGANIIPAGISTKGKLDPSRLAAERARTIVMEKLGLLNADGVQRLMTKIKSKARTERLRVIDFMQDFDHLRHGRITRNEFRRALKVLFLDLSEVELATLETLYQNEKDTLLVDYIRFSDDVEKVFTTKGLEREPTKEPEPFSGYLKGADPGLNELGGEGEMRVLAKALTRLRERIRQRRMDILPYLEDYDFVREGTITTNQFRSVLNTHNLPLDDEELRIIARRFSVDSSMDRINYRALATAMANTVIAPATPETPGGGGEEPLEVDQLTGVTQITAWGDSRVKGIAVPVNTFGVW
ncbi:hypothetical protein HDU96_007005 [Phlyctochytrium bullatum]|nr:hypothetical protein HDU96_007005 [Phlyctochytrium bullatum]